VLDRCVGSGGGNCSPYILLSLFVHVCPENNKISENNGEAVGYIWRTIEKEQWAKRTIRIYF
jgi:hypothetical protein